MLAQARIAAVVPVTDVDAAIRFYGDTLGLRLKERRSDLPENREAEFEAGDGTLLVYESVGAGQSRHTVAGFRVENIEEAVATLRERGVVFEEYDLPDMKTESGIATSSDVRAALSATRDATSSRESVGARQKASSQSSLPDGKVGYLATEPLESVRVWPYKIRRGLALTSTFRSVGWMLLSSRRGPRRGACETPGTGRACRR